MRLLKKAETWLPAQEQKAAGVTVTYTRAGESITIAAVVGRQEMAAVDAGMTRLITPDRDYLISAAALTFGTPEYGDRIAEVIGGECVTYEVMDQMAGEPWRFSDPTRVTWRIHVKRVQ